MRMTLVAFAVLASTHAGAQPAPDANGSPDDAKARAKTFYDEGTKRYDLGQYAGAVDAFRTAYGLLPEPLFLFDIGQAYRQLHDCENARSSYKSYLRNSPTADNRVKVEQFIVELDECVRKRDEAREVERRLALTHAPPPPPPARDYRLWVVGIITAASGLVVAAGGVYFSFDAADHARSLEQACLFGCDAADVIDIDTAGHDARRNAIVLYTVGGVALAAGVGMMLWATLRVPETVIVTPTPGGVTVSKTVRF